MNTQLRELHAMLLGHVQKLSESMDSVASPEDAQKILMEMQEFNHRATLVGGLLFRQESKELELKVDAVRAFKARLDAAVDDIKNLTRLLELAASFLALVDEVIDMAKLLP
ncbi:hypothetical protein RVX_R24540 [Nitratidesulfovibrio sp. HK-II]|jgi:hypothetical protein|uniref:hypothetical protein n=1 Tax=Nitratidesulfovibrio sp. HK-II TaxID=2009266 RepID=UPI000E2FD70C|nr:hypothetical protein [Nitratidesulfovibrio sp. HK-II]GBO96830.1 hypothetical protein RVX_1869 [Nitratidesulfovibrio sp. HK-II]